MVENWEDILNVAPSPGMACQPGEFRVAAAGLDHNHIRSGRVARLGFRSRSNQGSSVPGKVSVGQTGEFAG